MKFLPHHQLELESPLKPAAAIAAMAGVTEEEKFFRMRWPNNANDRRFEGTLSGDSFHVRRIIGYRNSFLPVIDGQIHAQAGGSRISIRMRPFVFVYLFGALWLLITLSFAFAAPLPYGPLFGIGMAAFFYLMTMGGFWYEASKQEQTLRDIFHAKRDTSTPLVS